MRISIVVPCRNEERFIGGCLASILATEYPRDDLEVLVVDGRSEDTTREIVAGYAARYPWVRLLDNPFKVVPAALNLGIREATGDVIMRMDAHVIYPPSYIPRLVHALTDSGADNVGGRIVTLPADSRPAARAIAVALGHPFGVGNSYFRIGASTPRWVDTVAFGCFKRDVFDRVGLFDEELVRNQDDEFNHRLIRHGGRVLLVPDVVSYYYARDSLGKVARMFYQYGYFKPLVAQKLGRIMTLRQLIPGLFVGSLVGSVALAAAWRGAAFGTLAIVAAYAVAVLATTLPAVKTHGLRCATALAAAFPVLHCSYGAGFWRGIVDHVVMRARRPAATNAVPLTR